MSFSSGTYSLYATGNPVVTNTTISSTWANNTLNDIATALSTCVLKDGTQTTTASVPFAFGLSATTSITTPSTTFALVNTTATTINFAGAATTINLGAAASATTWTGQSISLTGANSTNNTTLTITNTSNAGAASHAIVDVTVGGTTSTGDPQTRWTIPGGTSWYAGVDNSESDSWKLGTGTSVGTNTLITVTSAGAATLANGVGVGGATAGTSGIAFPATATAVADANTLDDYEEGDWAPNQGAGLTMVGAFSSSGKYTKIGRLVTIVGRVNGATSVAVTAAGAITSNLPFTVGTIPACGSATDNNASATAGCYVADTTTILYSVTAIGASPSIFFSVSYFI